MSYYEIHKDQPIQSDDKLHDKLHDSNSGEKEYLKDTNQDFLFELVNVSIVYLVYTYSVLLNIASHLILIIFIFF